MSRENVQEISLQLSPRNMATESNLLQIQFPNNIQIIFDSIEQHFSKLLKGCHYGPRYASDL